MDDTFRQLHMFAELACEFLAVFFRLEFTLKATDRASENECEATESWDRFMIEIEEAYGQVAERRAEKNYSLEKNEIDQFYCRW